MSGRRSLFAGAAAALMLGAAPLATAIALEPDAILLKLCGEFCRVCDQYDAIWEGPAALSDDEADAASEPLMFKLKGLADAVAKQRAQTPAGIGAMAHALERHAGHGGFSFDYPNTTTGKLLWAIMLDAATIGGAGPAQPQRVAATLSVPPHPDAELIRMARDHEALGRRSNADFPKVVRDDHPLAIAAEARRDAISEQQAELLDKMVQAPPTTLAGVQAVAAALVVEDLELLRSHLHDDAADRLATLMTRGLLDLRSAA